MPDQFEKTVEFQNFKNQMEMPFIVYADIESLLVPMTEQKENHDECMTSSSLTSTGVVVPKGATTKHVPNSVGYYFLSRISPEQSFYKTIEGPNCIEQFIEDLYILMRDVVWPKLL